MRYPARGFDQVMLRRATVWPLDEGVDDERFKSERVEPENASDDFSPNRHPALSFV
jgi:hypothetical protein